MLKAGMKLFSGSLFGKLAGALREMLLAYLFGTSGVVASIRAAQSATLIPVNFFTADSLSAGFLPLYSLNLQRDPQRANALFWWVAGLLLLMSVLTVVILYAGAPYWIHVLVPGFGPVERAATIDFVRVMGAGVPFYIAGGLFSYLEMGNGCYTLASARAALQSVGMILGTAGAYLFHMPSLLAWGFTAAYAVYCVWGVMRIVMRGWVPSPNGLTRLQIADVAKEFWRVVRPLIFLPIILQGNIVAERAVASLLGVSASSALDYAKFITDTGVLLLAVPFGLAGLSTFSQMSRENTKAMIEKSLPIMLIATIPLSVGLLAHGELVISLVYQRGSFDAASTLLTETILRGFAAGFWAQVISYILIKALSAQLRNKEVFCYMALALGANVLINFLLYRWVGPSVLGMASCAYAFVLLALASRSLGVGKVISKRCLWFSPGVIGYLLLASLVPKQGIEGLLFAVALFVPYWALFIACAPPLRGDVIPFWLKWRSMAT